MTKVGKIEFYGVIKKALVRKYGIDKIDDKIAEAISLLKGEGLPEDSDTLKELADKIVASQGGVTITKVKELIAEATNLPTQAEIEEAIK